MQNPTKARIGKQSKKQPTAHFALRVYLSDNKQERARQLNLLKQAADADNRAVTGFLFEAAKARVKQLIGEEL